MNQKKALAALQTGGRALDAYQLARATGLAPMTAGRILVRLARQGVVRSIDERGTTNDLAVRCELAPQPTTVQAVARD